MTASWSWSWRRPRQRGDHTSCCRPASGRPPSGQPPDPAPDPQPEPEPDQGSASVLGVQVISMLAVVTLVCCGVAALFADHRRAQSAADLGALAAATALQQGGAACEAATRIVVANGAALRSCAVLGQTVRITVSVRSPPLLGHRHDLEASARAGPVTDPSGAAPYP